MFGKLIKNNDIPFASLMVAILLYSLFSSPTPDSFSWIELIIAILLVIASGGWGILEMVTAYPFFNGEKSLRGQVSLLFMLLAVIPTVVGLVTGYSLADWLRDAIPLCYMFLPILMMAEWKKASLAYKRLFALFVGLMGGIIAVRFLVLMNIPLYAVGADLAKDGMLYLANEPLVLFSALYLPILALSKNSIFDDMRFKTLMRIICVSLGLCAVIALAATVQRAAILAVIVVWGGYGFVKSRQSILFAFAFICTVTALLFAFYSPIVGTMIMVIEKTGQVWDNARLAELRSVVDSMAFDSFSIVFGKGWGSYVYSPAAGHVWVRYTHMLLSYMFLKAGVLGLVCFILYLYRLAPYFWRLMWGNFRLTVALFPPVLFASIFSTGYKTLGYGILLSLLVFMVDIVKLDKDKNPSTTIPG